MTTIQGFTPTAPLAAVGLEGQGKGLAIGVGAGLVLGLVLGLVAARKR